jgi:hypothetical protein
VSWRRLPPEAAALTDARRECPRHWLPKPYASITFSINRSPRADFALDRCQRGETIDRATLDWLLADAHGTLNALSEVAAKYDLAQQSRILELLLCIANLNDYIAHHSV